MKLQVLAAVKAEVNALNAVRGGKDYEVWFPLMFQDGEWSCDVIFDGCPEGSRLQRLFSLLLANKCYWFFMTVNDDVAIHIQ